MKKFFYLAVLVCLPIFFTGCEKRVVDTSISIYGTVVDAETNSPIQGVMLTLMPSAKNRYTGSDGTYQFDDLEARQYKITATKDGYAPDSKEVTLIAGESENVSFALNKK
ncbi:MAG: carboxypeptidase regulatory-like domain-containing protein [Paludibacteraceae bacterium]|nr:carboxypeptidase regulatory-like domain-containing protein [Paludibacteraceae bacterium]